MDQHALLHGRVGTRFDGYEIRTAAVGANIPCITTVQGLGAAVQEIEATGGRRHRRTQPPGLELRGVTGLMGRPYRLLFDHVLTRTDKTSSLKLYHLSLVLAWNNTPNFQLEPQLPDQYT